MPQANTPTVIVDVGPVNPTDNNAVFNTRSDSAAVWTDYVITSRYEKDHHRYMLGNTSPDGFAGNSDTVSFVQLANSTLLWIVDWTACREKEKPKIPFPEQFSSSKWITLDEQFETGMIGVGPDGVTPIYRISGTYIYGHKSPNKFTNRDMQFPQPPWLKQGAFNREVDDGMFEHGIINNNNPQ